LGLTAFGSLGKLLHYPAMASASIIKYIPIFSHMLYWGGAVEATTDGIRSVLSGEYSGYSPAELSGPPAVAITPGGIAEMFWSYPRAGCLPDEEYALLRDRKGFVRIALQYGTKLVPIFAFGASQIFRRLALPEIFESASRWLRTSLLVFYGKFGLPIPFQVPILFALGDAVNLMPTADPSSEEVDFVSNIFIRELERTFESNKRFYGWEHKTLRVI
jgi:2-acylglycerol O-acyltransferase 2